MAATTHFLVADAAGSIACATQSQSLHFGAGVVPPGTGVVLNDSMSNFAFSEPGGINYVAPGKRPRSTIAPTLIFRKGRPILAIGIPGASRIPTALLQALLDRLTLDRPLAEAEALRRLGWKVEMPEAAGTGRTFGGINAIELNPGGGYAGYADPRRTNAAVGY